MPTPKQLAANSRNTQHATGPRPLAGQARSHYNALQHGILSRALIPSCLVPCESRREFPALRLLAPVAIRPLRQPRPRRRPRPPRAFTPSCTPSRTAWPLATMPRPRRHYQTNPIPRTADSRPALLWPSTAAKRESHPAPTRTITKRTHFPVAPFFPLSHEVYGLRIA